MRSATVIVALVALALMSGCSGLAQGIANHLVQTQLQQSLQESVKLPNPKAVARCVAQPWGPCNGVRTANLALLRSADLTAEVAVTAEVQPALRAFRSPAHRQIAATVEKLLTSETPPPLALRWSDIEQYQRAIEDATQFDSWDAMGEAIRARNLRLAGGRDVAASADERYLHYLAAYLRAYFRNGKFFQAKLDQTSLEKNLAKTLQAKLGISATDAAAMAKELLKPLSQSFGSGHLFGAIGETGLVTRGGALYQFPAVELKFDPTGDRPVTISDIKPIPVGNDLIRVFWEATFDSLNGLPAVSTATGVTALPEALRLPVNDTENLAAGYVSAADFATVDEWGSRADAASSSLIARVVRGASWASLNNEALSDLLATLVGVIVHKFTEKVVWCVCQCQPSAGIAAATLDGGPLELKVSVDGAPLAQTASLAAN